MLLENITKRCRSTLKFVLLCFVIIVIVMEWLEYTLSPMIFWPNFPYGFKNSVRILIVGDPQLLGYRFSGPGVFGFICRWDADRYISKTFSHAYHYVKPDIVIFLGDNLDEGELATDEEFHDYVKRFRYVFQEVDFHKAIIIPGDNDIGGEDEPPSPELEKRFNEYFRDDIFIPFKFLEFVKVNYITHSNKYLLAPNISGNAYRIALSHIPLTTLSSTFISRVLPYLEPHIILSAHDHKSAHWISKRQTSILIHIDSFSDFDSFIFNTSESHIHEIMVPTCSYRMGTDKMGYGALELSPDGEAIYAVLWLPSRFRQLIVYAVCAVFLSLYSLFFSSRACCKFFFNQNMCGICRLRRPCLMI